MAMQNAELALTKKNDGPIDIYQEKIKNSEV
jgi:hypothetical protein